MPLPPVSPPPLDEAAPTDSNPPESDPSTSDDLDPPPLIARCQTANDSTSLDPNLAIAPTILPENALFTDFIMRSLSRPALRMLWHQRLGHLNFRRLSTMHRFVKGMPAFTLPNELEATMHRFVKGMPAFTLPNELEACPVCLAAKLRKQPAGSETTMRSTVCNQGISIDFGFMVQRSKNSKRQHNLVGLNGETCYVLITDHYSGRLSGKAFASKAPPVEWLNNWLASNSPDCAGKYVRMDGGGELGRSRDVLRTFANFGYTVEPTGPDSSHQNGPGERPHQTIGDALRAMLSGANLQAGFWPYAFYHYLRLYNFVPHGTRPSSPYEMCGTELPDLSKLRTFGCRVHVRPTTMRYGKVIPNSRLGIFLGYSRSLKILYYYDLASALVKTATHARFDEGMNDLSSAAPPNVQLLRQLNNDGDISPDRLDLSPLNLSISDDPFEHLDELSPAISCDHPTLGFEISECHIRRRGYVSGIVANTSASKVRNVRRKYVGAYVVSVNDQPTFTAASVISALQSVASSDDTSFRVVFAPDRYIPVNRRRDSPIHLSVDQLLTINQIMTQDLSPSSPSPDSTDDFDCHCLSVRSLNTTTHGTLLEQALGSFTRRKLKSLPNWPDWKLSEFKQLDSMAKQEMYGLPCLPPRDAIILRQHWNYSLKADGTRKARNCCDGSPQSAPQLRLANTYSSCIEQPCMRMFFALCAHEGFIALKVDATNAYANSPPPDQPTFVYIDDQYADWCLDAGHGSPCPARPSRSP